jgi:hypothetical protein
VWRGHSCPRVEGQNHGLQDRITATSNSKPVPQLVWRGRPHPRDEGHNHRQQGLPTAAAQISTVLKCVHGKHKKRNPKHPPEAENQKAARTTSQSLREEFEFPNRRCGRSLRLRSRKTASRGPPSRSPGQIWTLHQERRHESVAVVVGNRARVAHPKMCLRQTAQ